MTAPHASNCETQSFGGPPPGAGSRHTYQSRLGLVARGPRLGEPRVPVRRVVRDPVDDDADPAPVARGDERVEVRERAEHRVDVAVVRDVVAEVGHGGGEERRQPDRLDRHRLEVVEVGRDPREVADAVPVGVREAARVDLVDGAALPPRGIAWWQRARLHRQPVVRLLPPLGSKSWMSLRVEHQLGAAARLRAAGRGEPRDDLLGVAVAVLREVLHAAVGRQLGQLGGLHGAVLDVDVRVDLGAHRLDHRRPAP